MKLDHSRIAFFCQGLALLLHSGIRLADGVFLLAEEADGELGSLLKTLGTALDNGIPLSQAMEDSGAFPVSVAGMTAVGEETGRLEEVLSSMGRFYEQRYQSSGRIRHALTYPSILFLLMLGVIGVLLIKVLPVFDGVYASLGSRLTGVAAGLLHLGRLLEGMLPLLLALLGAGAVLALMYKLCAPFRERLRGWLNAWLGDKGPLKKYNDALFARALSMGLASALPIEEAVARAQKLLADIPGAASRCRKCAERLCGGASLADAMGEAGFLSPAQCRILSVGLGQGSGDAVMEQIADRLMAEADENLERAVSRVEPAMVLIASCMVGLILLAVMLPLANIMSTIG